MIGDQCKRRYIQLDVYFRFCVINLVTSGHQKWDGKSTLFRPSFKSETDFTVPAVYVPRPMIGDENTM